MPMRCDPAKLRAKMAAANMTTAKLIAQSGVSGSTVNRILNASAHTASDYTVQQIADALGCSPYELLRDEAVEEAIHDETVQAIADAAQGAPVTPHSTLDIQSYVDTIKAATDAHLATMQRSRDTWRRTAIALFALLMAAIVYFAWEIFNPNKGITAILWSIYSQGGPM